MYIYIKEKYINHTAKYIYQHIKPSRRCTLYRNEYDWATSDCTQSGGNGRLEAACLFRVLFEAFSFLSPSTQPAHRIRKRNYCPIHAISYAGHECSVTHLLCAERRVDQVAELGDRAFRRGEENEAKRSRFIFKLQAELQGALLLPGRSSARWWCIIPRSCRRRRPCRGRG